MKTSKLLTKTSIIFTIVILLSACRSDFNLEEFDKLDDSLTISGKIGIPLINSEIKISNIKKEDLNPRIEFKNDQDLQTHIYIKQDDSIIVYDKINEEIEYKTNKEYLFNDKQKGQIIFKNPLTTLVTQSEKKNDIEIKIKKIDYYDKQNKIIGTISFENLIGINKVTINNENSNGELGEILKLMPAYHKITYTLKNKENQDNITVHILIDFPLDAIFKNLSIEDEIDFDIAKKLDNVENLEIKSKAENNTQLKYDMMYYFAKENKIIDSIYVDGPWKIKEGKLSNGNVVTEKSEKTSILPKERLQKIAKYKCDKLIYKTIINSDNEYIKIYDTQTLKMRVSFLAELGYTN